MLNGYVHYKKWQNNDIVNAATAKQMGLVEGVDYKKSAYMNVFGEKPNLLTSSGVEKANAFEIAKSRGNIQKQIDKLDKETNALIKSKINEMTKHQTRGENLLKGTGYPNGNSTPTSSTPSYKSGKTSYTTNNNGSTSQSNPVEDAQRKYLTAIKGYQKQLEDEQIDEEEFREKKREALVNMYNSLVNLYAEGNESAKSASDEVLRQLRQHYAEDFNREKQEYEKEQTDLQNSLKSGKIDDTDFDAEMAKILEKHVPNFEKYAEKIGGEAQEFLKGIKTIAEYFNVNL